MKNKFIPKSECKDRKLYRIKSRNLLFGVYRAATGGFFGLREKFGDVYVFEEYHWDNGPPYGTVRPIEELPEELPEQIENVECFNGALCSVCKYPCDYVKWPEGGNRKVLIGKSEIEVPGQWQHLDGTRCEGMGGTIRNNMALHKWLEEMEEKYYKQ